MPPPATSERDNHRHFPGEMIRHGVWLSSRFLLRERDEQALVCERGIDVTHAAIRPWWRKCGHDDANELRRRCAQPGNTQHLKVVFVTSYGQRHTWWHAVDQDVTVLAILGQSRRNQQAAQQLGRPLRKGLPYGPQVIMTDTLKRDGAAKRESLPGVEHRQSRSRHNRCDNAHRPTRQRKHRRYRLSAFDSRQERSMRCERWSAMTGTKRVSPLLSSSPL